MSALSYEFLKAELSGEDKARADTYLNSPLYYLLTGRKGAWLYKNHHSAVVVCNHPHIKDRLMVFPEIGKADYELTISVLDMLERPKNGIQLARYTDADIKALRQKAARLSYTPFTGISVVEENVMDWRYPVHILDTQKVANMEGGKFLRIRNKFRKAAEHITHVPLTPSNSATLMRAVLKFWEGNMIFNGKDTPDMMEFYNELMKVLADDACTYDGLLFLQGRKPLGFSIWDYAGDKKTANLFVNLGDTSVTGLSDYQIVTACQTLAANGVGKLNAGGSETENLDSFKSKFQPAESLQLFSADIHYHKSAPQNITVHSLVPRAG